MNKRTNTQICENNGKPRNYIINYPGSPNDIRIEPCLTTIEDIKVHAGDYIFGGLIDYIAQLESTIQKIEDILYTECTCVTSKLQEQLHAIREEIQPYITKY